MFDTDFWMGAPKQPRLTWLNLSADSKEQGTPASWWKVSTEKENDCTWGKEEEKKALVTVWNYRL